MEGSARETPSVHAWVLVSVASRPALSSPPLCPAAAHRRCLAVLLLRRAIIAAGSSVGLCSRARCAV